MDLVINAAFVLAKAKYFISFISNYLIQYPCIIKVADWNSMDRTVT